MKKMLTSVVAAAFALCVNAADETMSYADARSQITDVIADAEAMGKVVSKLSADDQVSYLSDVNEAIVKLQASTEEKVAKAVAVNRAALKTAKKGNLAKLLAEMFAVAMHEALAVANERFADELFNRAADPTKTFSDAEFETIAAETLTVVNDRCNELDDAAVRETFAILMFLRASNGTPVELENSLVALLPTAEARELAAKEWIPAAMGRDQQKSYEPMLAAADAGRAADPQLVMRLASPQTMDSLLADLNWQVRTKDGKKAVTQILDSSTLDSNYGLPRNTEDYHVDRVPRTTDEYQKWSPTHKRGDPEPTCPEEPDPYHGQSYR